MNYRYTGILVKIAECVGALFNEAGKPNSSKMRMIGPTRHYTLIMSGYKCIMAKPNWNRLGFVLS